jgi:hypothetical protein
LAWRSLACEQKKFFYLKGLKFCVWYKSSNPPLFSLFFAKAKGDLANISFALLRRQLYIPFQLGRQVRRLRHERTGAGWGLLSLGDSHFTPLPQEKGRVQLKGSAKLNLKFKVSLPRPT